MGEDVNNYLLAWKLYVKSPNSDSLFVSESVDTTTKVCQNNDNLIYDSAVLQAFTDEIHNPVGNYMFKVNNRNPKTRCEIFSKLRITLLLTLLTLLLTLNIFHTLF